MSYLVLEFDRLDTGIFLLILLLSKLGKGICFLGSLLHSELGMRIFKFKIFK